MLTAQKSNLVRLQERVTGAGKVDAERGIIYGVKILGKHSKNGRTYSDKAMAKLVKMYENKSVNVDHVERGHSGSDRSLSEKIGYLKNIKLSGQAIYGDLVLVKSHPMTEQVLEMAEHHPHMFGLSHDAAGRVARRTGGNIVEDVDHVKSVDLVSTPATNEGLFESVQNEAGNTFTKTQTPGVAQLRIETHETVKNLIDDDQLPIEEKAKRFRDAMYAYESGKQVLEDMLNAGSGPSGAAKAMAESYTQAAKGGLAAALRESSRNRYQSTSKPNSTRRSSGGESYDELTRGGFLAAVRR